jgi:fatty-acyl-CoA synthase
MNMDPTPTQNNLPLRKGDFNNLAEALDYAARGNTGYNFYDGTGKLSAVFPYKKLRKEARSLARRLLGLGPRRGARVALVADTNPDFMRYFYACQYAGLVPVPLPASIYLGGHEAFVKQLRRLLVSCKADIAIAPEEYLPYLREAADRLDVTCYGSTNGFAHLPEEQIELELSAAHELAYLQYTSGSTRFPRGVMITQQTVMSNLSAMITDGIELRQSDRVVSWLPFYHDMGLVGMVLAPLAAQVSVDFLSPRDFAMRPRLWLKLMSENRGTISFSPPFGYELCQMRLRPKDVEALDLSSWRVAGVGAEPITPEPLRRFAETLAPAGFNKNAFVAGYGMAECTLAVSFSPLGQGLIADNVDRDQLANFQKAMPVNPATGDMTSGVKTFVSCGEPLPGYDVQVRNEHGRVLPERQVGTLFVRGPSVMRGYFNDDEATREALSEDGWFDTGDLAYRNANSIIITGRAKDLIIINGRNVWPQDLENIAEQQPEVRTGDASAFSLPGADGADKAVLLVQCRDPEKAAGSDLALNIKSRIRREFGIDCKIELVPRHTLPRTTSGKLSRSKARQDYIQRAARAESKPLNLMQDSYQPLRQAV